MSNMVQVINCIGYHRRVHYVCLNSRGRIVVTLCLKVIDKGQGHFQICMILFGILWFWKRCNITSEKTPCKWIDYYGFRRLSQYFQWVKVLDFTSLVSSNLRLYFLDTFLEFSVMEIIKCTYKNSIANPQRHITLNPIYILQQRNDINSV